MEMRLIANVRRNIKIKEEKYNLMFFFYSVNLIKNIYISKILVFVAVSNKVVFYEITKFTKQIFYCQLN